MKKDEVWQKLKNDKSIVYGEPIFNAFLKSTGELKRQHYDELDEKNKNLVNLEVRLKLSKTKEEVDAAIKAGARDYEGALSSACFNGNLEIVKYLIEEKGVKGLNVGLFSASRNGHLEIIKYLVENAINQAHTAYLKVWLRSYGLNGVLYNASSDGYLDIVKYVVEKGADSLNSALHNAASGGHLEIVKYLVENGADSLNSALYNAFNNNRKDVVKYLLSKGAKDLNGALQRAINKGYFEEK